MVENAISDTWDTANFLDMGLENSLYLSPVVISQGCSRGLNCYRNVLFSNGHRRHGCILPNPEELKV